MEPGSTDLNYVDLVSVCSSSDGDSDSDDEGHAGRTLTLATDIALTSHNGIPQGARKRKGSMEGSLVQLEVSGGVAVAAFGSISSAASLEPLVSMPDSSGGSATDPAPASSGQKRGRSLVNADASAAPSSDRGALKRRRGEAGGDVDDKPEGHRCEVCEKVLSTMSS